MNFTLRSYEKELLDADGIPFPEIQRNMQELDTINTWLGGHAITRTGFKKLIAQKKKLSVCEIGCGGGDNLAMLLKWSGKNKILVDCIGIDIKKECIDYAAIRWKSEPIQWMVNHYRKVQFDKKPDIIFSSLFCHHFTQDELIDQLKWMRQNSTMGFFINDLHRHPLAYYSIRLLTRIFSRSRLVKNDAPLSVARGFKKRDWEWLINQTGIKGISVQWKWAFRYLVVCNNG
jgi:2-polyprenyl-3-methyl-5-hydroxy-6-metoxy-1,4-benzoquinol methylase